MTIRLRPREIGELREALAFGLHKFGLAVQTASQGHTPVHGGFRSFAPGAKPIGGTLRRSHYTVTYLDGRKIAGPGADENGKPPPDEAAAGGMVTIVGTNAGYGAAVHEGTSRMEARPFLVEGLMQEKGNAATLIAAGARRRVG